MRKRSLNSLTLYTSFHDLIDVYSCRSGADNPRGQNVDVNRNLLSLRSFATSFKKSLKSDFVTISFKHVYSPKAGPDNPLGTNFFYVNRNILSLWSFVANLKKKKISLKSDFIQFFHDFIILYSPRTGEDSPQGTKF